ncbi:hypothetical protein PTKIN_Ptkin02bG0051800 [Pterospermum kingtungense]
MKPLIFLTVFFFYLHPIATVSSAVDEPSATGTNNNNVFIRTSCSATRYPDLCYTSLSGHANAIQQDPARLARIAIGISLKEAHPMEDYVSKLYHQAHSGADQRARAVLHDCLSNLGSAVDEIGDSLKQMGQLMAPSSKSIRLQLGNVQTWMSSALTDQETCTDGFEDLAEGPMKKEVSARAAKLKMLTSNALALFNRYARKVTN